MLEGMGGKLDLSELLIKVLEAVNFSIKGDISPVVFAAAIILSTCSPTNIDLEPTAMLGLEKGGLMGFVKVGIGEVLMGGGSSEPLS